MLPFAATIFLSAFLLFAIQPMVAKFLLPSFGGTAAVWSTCLVFFQTLLLAGYAYAHLLRTAFSPARQRWIHFGLLVVSLLFLPPSPHVNLGANSNGTPLWELLRCLLTSIGVPFFTLSATAPLLMEWFRQSFPNRAPDPLYAFSNAGSLLALIGYPLLVEPSFTRGNQTLIWSAGIGVFVIICGFVGWKSRKITNAIPSVIIKTKTTGASPRPIPVWLWVILPACGSALLMALTNQISQDVPPMPMLWVVPMAIYLLTFVLCFEGRQIYRRVIFVPACFFCFFLLAWLLHEGYLHGFWMQVGGYLAVLFFGCMVCHGELYGLRPPAEQLTTYYLAISSGGALGGIFVAMVAPSLFKTLLETPIIATAIASIITIILWKGDKRPTIFFPPSPAKGALISTLALALCLGFVLNEQWNESFFFARNFYGVYRVKESPSLLLDKVNYPLTFGPARVLVSGQIYHGLQFTQPEASQVATTYYCEEGGLGLAFRELPVITNRNIGAIGLGTGTLAAYGRAGDHIRFYELNPDVFHIAETHFTFLTNCPAKVEVILGDGRLSLERELDQHFDLLVLDAFAGDSIPVHLLSAEAMRTYVRHLKPDGVMAFHISNSHLDLEPVVRAIAEKHGLKVMLIPPKFLDPRTGKLPSVWMLASANRNFFNRPALAQLLAAQAISPVRQPILWTDDYSSIMPILH